MPTSRSGKRPVLCVTVGDPRGIGPEVVRKALKDPAIRDKADFVIFGNDGRPAPRDAARACVAYLEAAFRMVNRKAAHAIVTGPVSKKDINAAGIPFEGHTEYLARLSGAKKYAMMFVAENLKVSLVTRHCPLKAVSGMLNAGQICDTVALTYKALKDFFGIRNPKVGVAGLNPHCGEGGLFGREEKGIIGPAVRKLKARFRGIYGPIPGDSLLHDVYHRRYDAAVCMYHDQGLAAFKMIARDRGVNLTLGLPFIRTSCDHGPAFDIARKGIADPGSMIEAIRLAIRLVHTC